MIEINKVREIIFTHDSRIKVLENTSVFLKKELLEIKKELFEFKNKITNSQILLLEKIKNIEFFLNKHFNDDYNLLNRIFWGGIIEFVLILGFVIYLFFRIG